MTQTACFPCFYTVLVSVCFRKDDCVRNVRRADSVPLVAVSAE